MNDELKIRIHITKGNLLLAEFHNTVQQGRSEIVFANPLRTDTGRHFEGMAIECWLDREANHVRYEQHPIILPFTFSR